MTNAFDKMASARTLLGMVDADPTRSGPKVNAALALIERAAG